MITEKEITEFHSLINGISKEISKDMVGQKEIIEGVLISMITGGNVLLEGVPGLGKTRLVRTIGRVFDLPFSRIQFTPDLMPADVVGTNIVVKDETGNSVFRFQPGPVFSNILLADEINRATPKTQSALLEAMQEHTVTVGGVSRKLDEPFFVLATQNPIEQEGTYPLPEAQIDRFMLKVLIGYPSREEEKLIMRQNMNEMMPVTKTIITPEQIIKARNLTREVYLDEKIENYITDIVFSTRYPSDNKLKKFEGLISYGASPRASINLALASKAYAFIKRRGYVIPEDVRAIAHDVLRHRIGLTYEAEAENISTNEIINEILNTVEVP